MLIKKKKKKKETSPLYAVAIGRDGSGIYNDWMQAQLQVIRFKGARFRKVDTKAEAYVFIRETLREVAIESMSRDMGKAEDRAKKRDARIRRSKGQPLPPLPEYQQTLDTEPF